MPAPTSLLGVLAEASSSAAQMRSNIEINEINNGIQNRLNSAIAALQQAPDSAVTNALQSQVTALQNESSKATDIGSQYGTNAGILTDLQGRLATMQTAIANGDGATFDAALAMANTDVGSLAVIAPTAPYQPDQVQTLQDTGLGIESSATYNLSTPSGQAAAGAAVTSAQNLIQQVFQATGNNQILAGSLASELSTQANALDTTLQQMQQQDSTAATTQIQQLTEQAQNQSHLIELALGNTQLLSTALMDATAASSPASSPLAVLQGAVGATPASLAAKQSTPALLSLLT